MNRLDSKRRAQVIASLVEGNSIRATVRMTGVAKNTVIKLLEDVGNACAEYQGRVFRDLPCKRIQCDEIWSFVGAKDKNLPKDLQGKFGYGSVWTWTAICADTKLVPSWRIGPRDLETAVDLMQDLASRLKHRVQLTSDGHKAYLDAVEQAFGTNIDYAMLIKIYGFENSKPSNTRYSPAVCVGADKIPFRGNPDQRHISTSFAERQNLTMRMGMRRFTRLTNGFSKKVENLACAVALHFMYYNFCRVHQSLRVTPAMEAGITDHVWSIEEVIGLL